MTVIIVSAAILATLAITTTEWLVAALNQLDAEFDTLMRALGEEAEEEESADAVEPTVVTLDFTQRKKAGLTVANARGGLGVRVVATVRGGVAQSSGLRVDDVIVSLNGLPARHRLADRRDLETALQIDTHARLLG